MIQARTYEFRDATSLARWARLSIYVQLTVACVAVISGYLEYDLLSRFRDGQFLSEQEAVSAAEASDARQRLVGIAQFIVVIASAIVVLRWIHRANWNARALGARNLEFTPGWAIGYYFVPLVNLWKPYQAMKEIWKASSNPEEWQSESVPGLVGLWWFLWIVHSLLGNLAFRMSLQADGVNELIYANIAALLSDLTAIPLCIVFPAVISRIQNMQSPAIDEWENGPQERQS